MALADLPERIRTKMPVSGLLPGQQHYVDGNAGLRGRVNPAMVNNDGRGAYPRATALFIAAVNGKHFYLRNPQLRAVPACR